MIGNFLNKKKLVKFSVKVQGESHKDKGIPCQDYCTARLSDNKALGIVFVADGHGGNKYFRSDKGSELAVQVAELAFIDFSKTMKANIKKKSIKECDIPFMLKQLESNIIYKWRNAVLQHIKDNPYNEEEKERCNSNNIFLDDDPEKMIFIYGTTLLAGLVSDNFWFVIQIGDGLCVVLENEEEIKTPIKEDERLAFGRTTSLCDNDAIDNFREVYDFSKIVGLTLATDGMSDSFEPEKYKQFNKELYDKFVSFPDKTKTEAELLEFLPEISARGSRDDISIAGIFRMKE
jgi:serine/threonine protein phosphatase PrpC